MENKKNEREKSVGQNPGGGGIDKESTNRLMVPTGVMPLILPP